MAETMGPGPRPRQRSVHITSQHPGSMQACMARILHFFEAARMGREAPVEGGVMVTGVPDALRGALLQSLVVRFHVRRIRRSYRLSWSGP